MEETASSFQGEDGKWYPFGQKKRSVVPLPMPDPIKFPDREIDLRLDTGGLERVEPEDVVADSEYDEDWIGGGGSLSSLTKAQNMRVEAILSLIHQAEMDRSNQALLSSSSGSSVGGSIVDPKVGRGFEEHWSEFQALMSDLKSVNEPVRTLKEESGVMKEKESVKRVNEEARRKKKVRGPSKLRTVHDQLEDKLRLLRSSADARHTFEAQVRDIKADKKETHKGKRKVMVEDAVEFTPAVRKEVLARRAGEREERIRRAKEKRSEQEKMKTAENDARRNQKESRMQRVVLRMEELKRNEARSAHWALIVSLLSRIEVCSAEIRVQRENDQVATEQREAVLTMQKLFREQKEAKRIRQQQWAFKVLLPVIMRLKFRVRARLKNASANTIRGFLFDISKQIPLVSMINRYRQYVLEVQTFWRYTSATFDGQMELLTLLWTKGEKAREAQQEKRRRQEIKKSKTPAGRRLQGKKKKMPVSIQLTPPVPVRIRTIILRMYLVEKRIAFASEWKEYEELRTEWEKKRQLHEELDAMKQGASSVPRSLSPPPEQPVFVTLPTMAEMKNLIDYGVRWAESRSSAKLKEELE